MTHAWLPRASCDVGCVSVGQPASVMRVLRITRRLTAIATLLSVAPLVLLPQPARSRTTRLYCRMMLRAMGVRVSQTGGPIRNVPGMLIVSPHTSWVDVLVIAALMPAAFVAKAELTRWPGLGLLARVMKVIPIDRSNLRRLPDVVDTIAKRLRAGQTVVAFPEGTTWCGLARGPFRPAMFQAAIDAGRPVQPLRLSYHHRDGSASTVAAFVGTDTLPRSILRVLSAPSTVAHVRVDALQLPSTRRRELAARCQQAVGDDLRQEHALVG